MSIFEASYKELPKVRVEAETTNEVGDTAAAHWLETLGEIVDPMCVDVRVVEQNELLKEDKYWKIWQDLDLIGAAEVAGEAPREEAQEITFGYQRKGLDQSYIKTMLCFGEHPAGAKLTKGDPVLTALFAAQKNGAPKSLYYQELKDYLGVNLTHTTACASELEGAFRTKQAIEQQRQLVI